MFVRLINFTFMSRKRWCAAEYSMALPTKHAKVPYLRLASISWRASGLRCLLAGVAGVARWLSGHDQRSRPATPDSIPYTYAASHIKRCIIALHPTVVSLSPFCKTSQVGILAVKASGRLHSADHVLALVLERVSRCATHMYEASSALSLLHAAAVL